jgi:hypothetical protein
VLIFGFKPARFSEWRQVLKLERKSTPLWKLLLEMTWVALKGLPHWRENRRRWRMRMRTCLRCPIYNPELHQCRPAVPPGIDPKRFENIGCGCVVWASALFLPFCWADEHLPESNIGWATSQEKSERWRKSPLEI